MANTEPEQTESALRNPNLEEIRGRAEEFVRDEPAKAVGIAFAAGIFLTIFPITRLIAGLLRLCVGLIKPLLIVFGAMKLYEELNKRNSQK